MEAAEPSLYASRNLRTTQWRGRTRVFTVAFLGSGRRAPCGRTTIRDDEGVAAPVGLAGSAEPSG